MNRTSHNNGFVLLLVLAVLVIAGVVLAGFAYRVSSGALQAGELAGDVQRKWASLSCKNVLLGAADDLLAEQNIETEEVDAVVIYEIRLNDTTFKTVLADEQAKANINQLVLLSDTQHAIGQIEKLNGDHENPPMLLFAQEDETENFESFDQIFDYETPSQLMNLNRLTCWSDGFLNYKTADLPTLEVLTEGLLTQTKLQELLEIRAENPECSLDELFKKLSLNDQQTKPLKEILTDSSRCKSLWVVAQGSARNWYHLFIQQADSENKETKTRSYQW